MCSVTQGVGGHPRPHGPFDSRANSPAKMKSQIGPGERGWLEVVVKILYKFGEISYLDGK